MHIVRLMFAPILLTTAALAQQAGAPPPNPEPDRKQSPSLDVTMKFIQDKLSKVEKVNYIVYCQDNINGDSLSGRFSHEKTNVVADASSCKISYHRKDIRDNQTQADQDFWVVFKIVKVIKVVSGDQKQDRVEASKGHPELSCRLNPPVWIVRVDDLQDEFYFYDEEMANRVAKAMLHAVELCGGQKGAEPF